MFPGPKTVNQTEATERKYQSTHHAKQLPMKFALKGFYYVRDGKSSVTLWDFAADRNG
jgi:hypothetical protein